MNGNTSHRQPAWAPVVNNVVVMVTIGIYAIVPGEISLDPVRMGDVKPLVLEIGVTLGIVVQSFMLLPALPRVGFKFRWNWGFEADIGDGLRPNIKDSVTRALCQAKDTPTPAVHKDGRSRSRLTARRTTGPTMGCHTDGCPPLRYSGSREALMRSLHREVLRTHGTHLQVVVPLRTCRGTSSHAL
ncbi:lipid II flippase MurJ [Kibdelosporangium aridum]|uniref:lipid II flippase MurJ n=1 Tax=Kibdelosporangium aridum TaxID=2030 RepID=UPI0035EC970D